MSRFGYLYITILVRDAQYYIVNKLLTIFQQIKVQYFFFALQYIIFILYDELGLQYIVEYP